MSCAILFWYHTVQNKELLQQALSFVQESTSKLKGSSPNIANSFAFKLPKWHLVRDFLIPMEDLDAFELKNRRSEMISRKRLSAEVVSWVLSFQPGKLLSVWSLEEANLDSLQGSKARAGLGGHVMGSYFLGRYVTAAVPFLIYWEKSRKQNLNHGSSNFPRKLCVSICSSLPSSNIIN